MTQQVASFVSLIWGEDEYSVKRRARALYQQWRQETGGFDHQVIDATASTAGEALRALSKLREALQVLPFLGKAKVIWFQDCNFLGEERVAATAAVTEALADLAQEWKSFVWADVRLLISAGKVDKRRTFYRTLEKIGVVESYSSWSLEDKDWTQRAEAMVQAELSQAGKRIAEAALAELVVRVGPQPRLLGNEVEKLVLYAGARPEIQLADVQAVVARQKHARAFALGDALGDRDLPRVLRALDEEMWEMKFDRQKSAIGLLYGLISKVRVLLVLKEMLRLGWLKPEAELGRFKSQLDRLPRGLFPQDKRLNPLAMHPYVLFKALPQTGNYSLAELTRAMGLLLDCNRKLVSSGLDESLIVQQTLIQILSA